MLERCRAVLQKLELAPYIYMIRACGQSGYIEKPMLREQCHKTRPCKLCLHALKE